MEEICLGMHYIKLIKFKFNINCNRSVRVKRIDENFQGESKVENRLRIERRGIEKGSRVLKKKGIGHRKGKQITD